MIQFKNYQKNFFIRCIIKSLLETEFPVENYFEMKAEFFLLLLLLCNTIYSIFRKEFLLINNIELAFN